MKIYKIKVNGKSYRVELEAIDEVKNEEKPAEKEKKVIQEQLIFLNKKRILMRFFLEIVIC